MARTDNTVVPRDIGNRQDDAAVVCDGLSVRYGRTVAVESMSFGVQRGEVMGLIGPNGAGKTSVIRSLTTILPLSAGSASVAGVDRAHAECIRSRIGVLPESSGFPGMQTAIQYLHYYGRLYGMSGDVARSRASMLLREMGLADRAHSRIHTYSRGMRQRLGIARALINSPEVLFLDEPTLGLDPAGKEEVLARVRGLTADGFTAVVLTSHLLDEIQRICDRVVIMDKGRVVSAGRVDDVITGSGLARSILVRVGIGEEERAVTQLAGMFEVADAHALPMRPGRLRVTLLGDEAPRVNSVAERLIAADVSVLAVELEGASLSDAFLRLTGDKEEQREES